MADEKAKYQYGNPFGRFSGRHGIKNSVALPG
jgi:hypothetical protein